MLSVLTFRTPGRGGREGQQHARTACPPASGPTRARASSGWPSGCAPAWSGPTRSTVRPGVAVRRLQGVGLRPRGRPPRVWRPTSMSDRLDVRKTYKLYIGGKFPRSESGRSYEVTDSKGRFLANAALASRKDARDAVVAARAAFPGWSGATAYNRGQVLYRVAELHGGPARAVRRGGRGGRGAHRPQGRRRRRRRHRPLGLVRRLVRQARPGRRRPTRSPGRTSTSPCPSRPASSPCWRRSGRRCSAWSPSSRRSSSPATPRSWWPASDRPLPAVTLAEVLATSDVPGGVVNVLTGRTAEVAPWLASHMDVNAIDLAGVRPRRCRPREGRGRQPQAGAADRWTPTRTGRPSPGPSG